MPLVKATTQVCAIFGDPVGHSLSPALHNAGFEALGLDCVYLAHRVHPTNLEQALLGAKALGYRGLSITIPHKVAALRHLDEIEPTARGIGCINTVVIESGRLLGSNSDGLGALSALTRAGAEPRGKNVSILGSGGAARAIAVTLATVSAPRRIVLLGIDEPELLALAETVRAQQTCEVTAETLSPESLARHLPETQLLLHASPVGMAPHTDATLVPRQLLRPGLTVFDAVYTPRRTRLLVEAEQAGATIIEGCEMFLGQALVQFQKFTLKGPPIDVMRKVLYEHLGP